MANKKIETQIEESLLDALKGDMNTSELEDLERRIVIARKYAPEDQ